MEQVLGPGTHKKPVATEEAEVPKVGESDGLSTVVGRLSLVVGEDKPGHYLGKIRPARVVWRGSNFIERFRVSGFQVRVA